MDKDAQDKLLLDILSKEYDKLKSEQCQRIAHRDSLVYATFVAIAAIATFALKADGNVHSLLALPFICFALGWTHLNNDHKITAIGKYIGSVLRPTVSSITGQPEWIFGWEIRVRSRRGRRLDKLLSFFGNGITFMCPGAAAICVFLHLHPNLSDIETALIFGGWAAIVILTIAMVVTSDLRCK